MSSLLQFGDVHQLLMQSWVTISLMYNSSPWFIFGYSYYPSICNCSIVL